MRFSKSRGVAKAMDIIADVAEMEGRYEAELDALRARVEELEADKLSGFFLPYAITDDEAKELADPATFIASVRNLRAENARLRAALEAAPTPTEPGPYHMETVQQREWHNYRHWFHTTRAEALK